MMGKFTIETGESLNGPWQDVQKYRVDIVGPEEPSKLGRVSLFKVYMCCVITLIIGEVQDLEPLCLI